MRSFALVSAVLTAIATTASAAGVTGSAEGFAKGVTGGGSAAAVYPKTTDELVSYLGDSSPRVIVLTKTFDFTGTEGTTTSAGCSPWGTGSQCQQAIDQNGWCENYQSSAPKVGSITYNKAGVLGITVNSNKSLVGQGSSGVIKGKGLRMVSGAKNIIIQNIAITDINPHYVWGGDAITLDGTDMIWIDHVTTQRIARQHIVLGESASGKVSITNCDIDGASSWSATCDGRHYWALYFTGSNDMVTFKNNYVHHVSGRAPKVQGNTLLHAVNNYWYDIDQNGHGFEIGQGGYVLAEGNVFQNVKVPVESPVQGKYFTVPGSGSVCSSALGRSCVNNSFGSSGTFSSSDTSFLSNFKGKNIATASAASAVSTAKAGYGKI